MKGCRLIITAIALFIAGEAMTQTVYRWVDDEGEVHYGHGVPPEHADKGYDVLGRDGSVRRTVEPALSPEEIAELRAQRRQEAEQEKARRSQEAHDRMLLATYSSEQDLIDSLEAEIASLNSQRTSINTAIHSLENRFESLVARAAEYSRDDRPVPASLEESIDETRNEIRRLRADLEALDEREQLARERSRAELERYRALTGSGDG